MFLCVTLLVSMSMVSAKKDDGVITIQDGLLDSSGNAIELGYDEYGYNYQAHMFNGYYENYSRPDTPVTSSDTKLIMKWNDAWLSNCSQDGDLLLDRHYGYDSYYGSGAWLTNLMTGTYEDGTHWSYYCKIVAVPTDAIAMDGVWYTSEGVEIGSQIWGAFAIIFEVCNDPPYDANGVQYISSASPGFGYWMPKG